MQRASFESRREAMRLALLGRGKERDNERNGAELRMNFGAGEDP
jgi:hypothetical protein